MELHPRQTPGASVTQTGNGWRLTIPPGPSGLYRWAQVDDYLHLPRRTFPWQPPVELYLEARVSHTDLPGTWGFGFWNDPFSLSLGVSGTARRIPALPQAAWFFHASPPNHLAFRDGLPAQGFLAASFASLRIPTPLLAPGLLLAPLLALPLTARLIRKMARLAIRESGVQLTATVTDWHAYRLEWREQFVRFEVDGHEIHRTQVSPRGRLGLVVWIDNQYAAFPPDGHLRAGTLANQSDSWLEIRNLRESQTPQEH